MQASNGVRRWVARSASTGTDSGYAKTATNRSDSGFQGRRDGAGLEKGSSLDSSAKRRSALVGAKKVHHFHGQHRLGKQIALRLVAAERAQDLQLRFALYALRNHGQTQAVSELGDGEGNRLIALKDTASTNYWRRTAHPVRLFCRRT